MIANPRDGTEEVTKEKVISQLADMELARRDFLYFLNYCYIDEPPQPLVGRVGGKVPFEKWDYVLEMAEAFTTHRTVVILKPRQIGFSWVAGAYASWTYTFLEGAVILILSRDQPAAFAFLKKVKFILQNLPELWRHPLDINSRGEISYETENGVETKATALASTEDAGRSETATLVIQDEADFHPYLEDNHMATRPTVAGGGQIIMGSTSNRRDVLSFFKGIYKAAPGNGWKDMFFHWSVRPGRDQDWYEAEKASIPGDRLDGLSPEEYMEREYPSSPEEALRPSRAGAYFDVTVLEQMDQYVTEPLREVAEKDEDYRDIRNFYIKRSPRGRYVAGTDVGGGVGLDYSVTTVLNVETMHVVADIMVNTLQPEEFAEESLNILRFYRNPLWGVERNGFGLTVVDLATKMKYPRLYRRNMATRQGAQRSPSKEAGWVTDKDSRARMWGRLKAIVDDNGIVIHSKEGLRQLHNVLRTQEGAAEHVAGAHDDYPTALAIAWYISDRATITREEGGPTLIVSFHARM